MVSGKADANTGTRQPSGTLKVGIVSSVLGALIQLSHVADKFPFPLNQTGYVIIFCSVVVIAWDLVIRRS